MKISLKLLIGILLIGFISVNSYSQNDTTKIKKIDSEINVTKSTDQLKAKSLNTNVNPNASIDLKIEKQINTEAIEKNLNAISIMKTGETEKHENKSLKETITLYKNIHKFVSPIRFSVKEFFPNSNKQSIFEGCDTILKKVKEGRFEYETLEAFDHELHNKSYPSRRY